MNLIDREPRSMADEKAKIVLITGVEGVGKDYYLTELKKSGSIPESVKVVSIGTVLFQYLKRSGQPVETKYDIRKLDPGFVDSGIRTVVQKATEGATGTVLLNAHVIYRQGDELVNNVPLYESLGPIHAIIDVMGYPDDIYDRRQKSSRRRSTETPDMIASHQLAEFESVLTLASSTAAELVPLMSRPRQLAPNLHHLAEAIRDFTG